MSVEVLDHIRFGGVRWDPADNPGIRPQPLAVVGTAPGWEYESELIPDDCDIMAVNDAGCDLTWRLVKWWATLHPQDMRERMPRRLENGGDFLPVLSPFPISRKYVPPDMICKLALEPTAGSSAMFAVLAGLFLGYRDIVLYGVRIQDSYEIFQEQWIAIAPIIKAFVTAPCPGFPREFLAGVQNKVAPE